MSDCPTPLIEDGARPIFKALPALALLDLDGTLADTVPDIAASIDHALVDLGLEPAGEARVRGWVGNGAQKLIDRALSEATGLEVDPLASERAIAAFMEHYAGHLCVRSRLYPGVLEGLTFLRDSGAFLACITNKPASLAQPLLDKLGLGDYFGLTLGGDSLEEKKPAPLPLRHAMSHFAAAPTSTLMIGDSVTDVRAARAARVRIICVSYGYNPGGNIAKTQPDAVLDSLAELPALFDP